MAFRFRTPLEEVVQRMPKDVQDELASTSNQEIVRNEREFLSRHFSFSVTDDVKEYLSNEGVTLSPLPWRVHTHPACKTIENFILYVVLPEAARSYKNLALMSIKKNKYDQIKAYSSSKPYGLDLELINRIVTSRDRTRYGEVQHIRKMAVKKDFNYFIHDELHYWSMSQIEDFLSLHKPKNVLATFIYPVELLFGHKKSILPKVYTFEIMGEDFSFAPDGRVSEAYIQPLAGGDILRMNHIGKGDNYYTVTLLRSIGAHHLLHFRRGGVDDIHEKVRQFGTYPCIDIGPVFGKKRIPVTAMDASIFKKVVFYLFSLKKPDQASAVAKLRQLMNDDMELEKLWFVRDLVSFVQHGNFKWNGNGVCGMLVDWLKSFGGLRESIFASSTFCTDERAFMTLENIKFTLHMDREGEGEPEFDMEAGWSRPSGTIEQRAATTYVGMAPLRARKFRVDYSKLPKSPPFVRNGKFLTFREETVGEKWARLTQEVVKKRAPLFDIMLAEREDARRKKAAAEALLDYHPAAYKLMGGAEETPRVSQETSTRNGWAFVVQEAIEKSKGKKDEMERGWIQERRRRAQIESSFDYVPAGEVRKPAQDITEREREPTGVVRAPPETKEEVIDEHDRGQPQSDLEKETKELISELKESEEEAFNETLEVAYQRLMQEEPNLHNGRKSWFYHSGGLAYFHDKVAYVTISGIKVIDDALSMVSGRHGKGYNSLLLQMYEKGAKIGEHRDDEDCYDEHLVLTHNWRGDAEFHLEGKKIQLSDNTWINFKNTRKHSVIASSERISATFRIQNRQISMRKALQAVKPFQCLMDCFSKFLHQDTSRLFERYPNLLYLTLRNKGVPVDQFKTFTEELNFDCQLIHEAGRLGNKEGDAAILLEDDHYSVVERESQFSSKTQYEKKTKERANLRNHKAEILKRGSGLKVINFKADKGRAVALASSMLDGRTGVMLHQSKDLGTKILPNCATKGDILKKIEEHEAEAELIFKLGFAGSGKSRFIQEYIRGLAPRSCAVISPRANLKQDWVEKTETEDAFTFETALVTNMKSRNLIIIDEYTLFPPGYIDLFVYKMRFETKREVTYVILGDPLQAPYHNDRDSYRLQKRSEVEEVLPEAPYMFSTYRLNRQDATSLGVSGLSERKERVMPRLLFSNVTRMEEDLKSAGPYNVIVASRAEKEVFKKYGAMTFGESQGLTFKLSVIVLSEETKLVSDNHMMVALTRATDGYFFLRNFLGEFSEYKNSCKGLLRKVLDNEKISYFDLQQLTKIQLIPFKAQKGSGLELKNRRLRAIRETDEVDREEKLNGDPWLKGQINLFQRVNMEATSFEEPESNRPSLRTHVALCDANLHSIQMDRIRDKYQREIKTKSGSSTQFMEERRKCNREENLPQCAEPEAIYMMHKHDDTVTLWAAIRKRLKFSSPGKNYSKFIQSATVGKIMLDCFLEHVPMPSKFNADIYDEAVNDFELKKLSKATLEIAKNSIRSDPDRNADEVSIFLKNQLCTKFEKRFMEGKAGQTIACFHHNILVRFAPLARYIEKVFSMVNPGNFYIHQKKNFEELENFVLEHYTGEPCTASDYTAFDSSQDHYVLSFEVQLLNHMGIPQDLIEDYIMLKTTLGSTLGNLAIMRFTGEFSTFLFNTFCNMVFTFMKYKVSRDSVILFAGDDMASLTKLFVCHDYDSKVLSKLSLVAKVEEEYNPLFCGWRLCKYGLFKEPCLNYERLLISKSKGTLNETMTSYFIDFYFAYKKGFLLEDIMSAEQLEIHYKTTRFFLKHENFLHPSYRALLHNSVEDWDSDPLGDSD
uniref:RdRp n=1 Tax=Avocado betaflexivirus 1 TaxID=2794401 RepID=A0A7T5UEX2_9VIRU|nr:RdRp [Avocado betaflexivirus 1]